MKKILTLLMTSLFAIFSVGCMQGGGTQDTGDNDTQGTGENKEESENVQGTGSSENNNESENNE